MSEQLTISQRSLQQLKAAKANLARSLAATILDMHKTLLELELEQPSLGPAKLCLPPWAEVLLRELFTQETRGLGVLGTHDAPLRPAKLFGLEVRYDQAFLEVRDQHDRTADFYHGVQSVSSL